MTARTTHFRVDNGDMTLIETENGRRILIDCNIRAAANDEDGETPDVATQLRDRLLEAIDQIEPAKTIAARSNAPKIAAKKTAPAEV